MNILLALGSYYAYDNMRGDGYAVRFPRLNMLTAAFTPFFFLAWGIELAYALAYFSVGRCSPTVTKLACGTVYACFAIIYAMIFA